MAFSFCGSSFSLRGKRHRVPCFSLALLDACLQDALSVLLKLRGYIILFSVLSNVITHIPRMRQKVPLFPPAFWKLQAESRRHWPHLLIPQSYMILPRFWLWRSLLFSMQTGRSGKSTPYLFVAIFTKMLLALLDISVKYSALRCFRAF